MRQGLQTGFAHINGTKLYYEAAGAGHPLVLNHGGLVDNHLWDDQFDAFARHYRVIRYDIRGFGESGLIEKDTQPYSMKHDLYALLQFLGVEQTYILGLSMGGALAVDFTLQYPAMVDALITVGAGLGGFEMGEPDELLGAQFAEMEEAFKRGDIARSVEISLRIWTDGPQRTPAQVDPGARQRVAAMTTHNFQRGDSEDVQPNTLEPSAAGRLAEIHVPTLIIVGAQDSQMITRIADALEKGITGAQRAVIPGTAHHPNLEKPQEFNRLVLEFLQQLNT
jgi:3-oxoadipate enol-lactonase